MRGCIFIMLLLYGCQLKSVELPMLSYKIDDSGNKVPYKITYEGFTNQFGEPFTTTNIQGKVVVSNFFFHTLPKYLSANAQ